MERPLSEAAMWLATLLVSTLPALAGDPAARAAAVPSDDLAVASELRAAVAATLATARALHADASLAEDASRAACVARKLPSLDALDRLADGAVFVVEVGAAPPVVGEQLRKLDVARERAEDLLAAARACSNELVAPADMPSDPALPVEPGYAVAAVLLDFPPAECGTCR